MPAPQAQQANRSATPSTQQRVQPVVNGIAVRKPATGNAVPVQQNTKPSGTSAPSLAAKKPAATAPPGEQAARPKSSSASSRLDDPKFKEAEVLAANIVVQLKGEAKTYYERLGKTDSDVRYGGRFLHNREVIMYSRD